MIGDVAFFHPDVRIRVRIVIQHDLTTGRYHPSWYTEHSPGPGPRLIERWKSRMHHTEGYDTLEGCRPEIHRLAEFFCISPGQEPIVQDVTEAGPTILILPAHPDDQEQEVSSAQ